MERIFLDVVLPVVMVLMFMVLILGGCVLLVRFARSVINPEGRLGVVVSEPGGRYYIVPVYFATDRKPTGDKRPSAYFSAERGELVYGLSRVTIPRRHHLCTIERPHWWGLQFRENPDKHIVLLTLTELPWDQLMLSVTQDLVGAMRYKVLIFVHGYNVSFAEAVRRTAQLAFDLSYDGVPFLYSWPSVGTALGYLHDLECAKGSASKFKQFVLDVATQSTCGEIQIIAHSMGGLVITEALRDPELRAALSNRNVRLSDVVLAAPDIDAKVFAEEIVPAIAGITQRVTVYASSGDMPLTLSSFLRGGLLRAGVVDPDRGAADTIDTIDASNVADGLLGHGYFSDTAPMINDMYHLLRHGHAPPERNLRPAEHDSVRYWIFPPQP